MEVIGRTVTLVESDPLFYSYWTPGSGMNQGGAAMGYTMSFTTKNTSWVSASINSTGMDHLFPNSVVTPVKADFSAEIGKAVIFSATASGKLIINGTTFCETSRSSIGANHVEFIGSTDSAITSCTKSSTISLYLKTSKSSYAAFCATTGTGEDIDGLIFYFNRYSFVANSYTGIASTSVTSNCVDGNSYGYKGDTVTFSCTVEPGYAFDGWYNGSTKVSSNVSYSITVDSSDLTLTPKSVSVGKTVTVTYSGGTICTTLEQGTVNVSYNNQIIISDVTGTKTLVCANKLAESNIIIGSRTLNCAGKIMSSDIVIDTT